VPGDDDVRRRDGPVWRAQQLDRFIEAGGTLVDTADVYGGGRSEEIIGRWFASRPSDVTEPVVLATKGDAGG
jgi:aryl-alcohol dehydrogenase (NADP+)